MVFEGFRFQVVSRVVALTLTLLFAVLVLLPAKLYYISIAVGLIVLLQVYFLIRYVERTNLYLNRFFSAVKYGDFSRIFDGQKMGSSFARLTSSFNQVLQQLQRSRAEKEEQYRYLQTIVHHVGIGLISFKSDGTVDLVNSRARKIFKIANLRNIKALAQVSDTLVERLLSLKHGERALIRIEENEMELAVHAAEFKLKDQAFTLVSLQDIRSELQEKEMEAWQTLIRVLTHEIMNSMTPITSMTATAKELLNTANPNRQADDASGYLLDAETLGDITSALDTIHKRSTGLTHFVNTYRNLTLIPKPQFKLMEVEKLFRRVKNLLAQTFRERNIRFTQQVDPQSLQLTADPGLMEQVLLNLLLNSIDALQDCKEPEAWIRLQAGMDQSGSTYIEVSDNGPGITAEAQKKVFIPFFTTKKKGSGIGLSLSRQIMKLHGGSIRVQSEPDVKTSFTLRF